MASCCWALPSIQRPTTVPLYTKPEPERNTLALQFPHGNLDQTEEQIGLNQTLFREVNERVRELNETFATLTGIMQIICECGDSTCVQTLSISPSEYDHLRSDPTWFAVVPGHAVAPVERVIATYADYRVVQIRRGAAAQAEAADPHA